MNPSYDQEQLLADLDDFRDLAADGNPKRKAAAKIRFTKLAKGLFVHESGETLISKSLILDPKTRKPLVEALFEHLPRFAVLQFLAALGYDEFGNDEDLSYEDRSYQDGWCDECQVNHDDEDEQAPFGSPFIDPAMREKIDNDVREKLTKMAEGVIQDREGLSWVGAEPSDDPFEYLAKLREKLAKAMSIQPSAFESEVTAATRAKFADLLMNKPIPRAGAGSIGKTEAALFASHFCEDDFRFDEDFGDDDPFAEAEESPKNPQLVTTIEGGPSEPLSINGVEFAYALAEDNPISLDFPTNKAYGILTLRLVLDPEADILW